MGCHYLSENELEHIRSHKYKSAGYSKLDNIMDHFWKKCALYLPRWLSPNMVTAIGLIFQIFGIFLIMFYDFSMSKPLPYWMHVFMAFCLFMYQTLDAIDGKHARNTNRSSPVGQLMDHGCDAFSNSFLIIMVIQSHRLGGDIYTIAVQILVQLTFYVVQWHEYYTGYLVTHINNMGVTEFQFIGMIIIMIPVLLGNVSETKLFNGMVSVSELLVYLNGIYAVYTLFHIISANIKTKEDFMQKSYPIFSALVLTVAELLCLKLHIFKEYTLLIIILNGLFFAFMTSRLILCTMAKKQIERFTYDNLIYLLSIVVCIYSNDYFVEIVILSLNAIYISVKYLKFMYRIINDLLNYLNISF